MGYLWYCEAKKLVHNKVFCWMTILLLVASVMTQAVQLFFNSSNVPTSSEQAKCYSHYEEYSLEDVVNVIGWRMKRLELLEDIYRIEQLPASMRSTLVDQLEKKWEISLEEMNTLVEPLEYCGSIEEEISVLECVLQHAQESIGYADFIHDIDERKRSIQNSILFNSDDYSIRLAEITQQAYQNVRNIQLPLANPQGVEIAVGMWVDDLIRFLFAVFVCVFLFLREKESGGFNLIFSTKNGCTKLYWTKIGLAVVFSIAFCLLTQLVQIICGVITVGFGDLNRPAQTIPRFYACPYLLNVWQLLLINCIIKLIATIAAVMLVSIFCINFESVLAWVAMIVFSLVSACEYLFVPEHSLFQPIRYLNIVAFSQTENLIGNAIYLKIGDIPFPYFALALLMIILCVLVGLFFGMRGFSKPAHQKSPPRISSQRIKNKSKTSSMFILEAKKLVRRHAGILLLLLLLVCQFLFYGTYRTGITLEEQLLERRLSTIEGEYSEAKHMSLQKEYSQILAGEILCSDRELVCIEQLMAMSDYLEERSDQATVSYVYGSGYEVLLGIRRITLQYQPAAIAITLCLLLAGIFTQEYESGMLLLNMSAKNRNKLIDKKICLALIVACFVNIIWWIPEVIFTTNKFALPCPWASSISLRALSNNPSWLPLWGAVLIVWIVRSFGAVTIGVLVMWVSSKTKIHYISLLVNSIIVGSQGVLYLLLPEAIKPVTLFGLLSGNGFSTLQPIYILSIILWCGVTFAVVSNIQKK